MSMVSVAEIQAHIETDLTDPAIQRLINDAEAEIDDKIGEFATQFDEFQGETMANAFYLTRKASEITTVVEEVKSGDGYTATTLSADDYELRFNGRQLRRLTTGTNPAATWGDTVTVLYVPKDDEARRIRVTIDLVKLAIAFNALDSEKIGDYSAQSTKYEVRRSELIRRLKSWDFA